MTYKHGDSIHSSDNIYPTHDTSDRSVFDNVNLPAPYSTGYRPVWLDIQFSF